MAPKTGEATNLENREGSKRKEVPAASEKKPLAEVRGRGKQTGKDEPFYFKRS
ncbi:MAG: hypothetical protein G01um101416_1053 [Microgenomates group bacterium Gr01-1014_16]|nr:MAG: hypothetical protein G01um101416_1053 [Microgenomates group bacterium Gr01-1014_16]